MLTKCDPALTNIVDHGSASVLFEVKYRFSDPYPNITSSASIYSTTSIQSVAPSKVEYILPFDLRYSTYRGEKIALLSQIQKQLVLNQDYQVLIVGHTDSQGAKAYN
ncbi:hypothetical protein [Shewanella surugensis]|uniref:OmpA-like domain-containing protein n=1 Tax=Shewanella surugensis TaxID=212020 RepID=A0ABT0LII1_9GAMM|nr:hypothetical protein [Shewanella surugensis]MCL1127275.1 hypothetical protein [Shewanella surugensis]